MSDWWNTSDGEDVTQDVKKEFDSGGGGFALIPERTKALATILSAAWAEYEGKRYVNVKWSITKPDEYLNRQIYQKIWCGDLDPKAKDPAKKRDKALRMLATIDANSGGKLAKAGREPDDDDLALALTNKVMGITIMVWKMDTDQGEKEGNWISSIAPKAGFECTVPPKSTGNGGTQKRRPDPIDDDLDGDDIPF